MVRAAEPLEIVAGLTVPVARIEHLIAVKLLARNDDSRPQDAADLRALLAVAIHAELDRARDATQLIEPLPRRGWMRRAEAEWKNE